MYTSPLIELEIYRLVLKYFASEMPFSADGRVMINAEVPGSVFLKVERVTTSFQEGDEKLGTIIL